jgi:hypothetical protein
LVKVNYGATNAAMKPVPAGTYPGHMETWKYHETSGRDNTGPSVYNVEYQLDEAEFEGKSLFKNYFVTPKALMYLKRDMIALGIDPDIFGGDETSGLPDVELDDVLDEAKGKACALKVSLKTVDGRELNNIDAVLDKDEVEWA